MKTALLFLAAAAAFAPTHAGAARLEDPQQAMVLDLHACPRPAYPAAALAERIAAKTTVEVQVGAAGRVTDARIATSSGRSDFDEAALAGIRVCVFNAVVATGQAPTGWLKTQYVWVPGAYRNTAARDLALFDGTRARAAAGDAIAQNTLGTWYEHGNYVEPDLAQAAAWYRQAAEGGNAFAQNNLGVLYHSGRGVPQDQAQAVYWYTKAAEQGHRWAQANLAWAYEHGAAVEQDPDKALYWMTEAAKGGLAHAQLRLGQMTMVRAATDAERSAAAAWIARAAAQDFAPGAYYLGRSFELGLGNPQDDAQAAAWYRKALGRSEGRAETALGMLVEAGRAGAPDQEHAAKLYQQAMQSRFPEAFYRYGLILEQRGDLELANVAFMRGAQAGNCDAAVKYAQLAPTQGTASATDVNDTGLTRLAQACAGRPTLPPTL